jgi:hypothetical protein
MYQAQNAFKALQIADGIILVMAARFTSLENPTLVTSKLRTPTAKVW